MTRRKVLIGLALLACSYVVVLVVWVAWWYIREKYWMASVISCRAHASFVHVALEKHLKRHGSFPHVPRLPGEELFCTIDFGAAGGVGMNCTAGAPGQGHGGWQMLNASRDIWDSLLDEFGSVPIVWCGRSHEMEGGERVVLLVESTRAFPGSGARGTEVRFGPGPLEIRYMKEARLIEILREVNAILTRHGEPGVAIDVSGRSDYWSLALPHQNKN